MADLVKGSTVGGNQITDETHNHDTEYYTESEIDSLLAAIGGNSALLLEVTQSSHGFSQFNSVYHNGTNWQKAQANSEDTLGTHIVVTVTDTSNFTLSNIGVLERTSHGLTVGEYYYTDYSTAGAITITEPVLGYSNPLMYIPDANNIQVFPWRPSIAEANLDIANIISEDITYTIGSAGDYPDFQTALEALTHYIIADGADVTLKLGTGFTPVSVTQIHPQGDRIILDLYGQTYTLSSGNGFEATDGNVLNIKNSSATKAYITGPGTGNGVEASDGGIIKINPTANSIDINTFTFGAYAVRNSLITCQYINFSSNNTGLYSSDSSMIFATSSVVASSAGYGFQATVGSTIYRQSATGADATDSSPAVGVIGNNNSIVV